MSNSQTQKEQIADLSHRAASTYGQMGPNIFAYAGQHLVQRIAMAEGTCQNISYSVLSGGNND